MNRTKLFLLINLLVIVTLACGTGVSKSTPDNQATIDAAVAGTGTAQAANQATIDAAVQATTVAQTEGQGAADQATDTAQADSQAAIDAAVQATGTAQADSQAAIDAAVQATSAAASTPVPAEEYTTMTEEELAALIDQAVTEAVAATEQYSTATTNAAADDAVTQEEVETLEIYVSGAEEAIAYADELISAYYSLYGELATETIEELNEIEQALDEIAAITTALNDTLQVINSSLEQGLELAEDTIAQLETAAQTAGDKAGAAQQQAQTWTTGHQAEVDNRLATVVAVQPNQVADNPQAAVQSALEFITAAQQATADNQISAAELANLAQLGANAGASLDASGNPQLQELSGKVNEITGLLARGDTSQALVGLNNFGNSLGGVPGIDIPSLPGGDGPSLPGGDGGPSRPAGDGPTLPGGGGSSRPGRGKP